MKLSDVFNSKAVALSYTEAATNDVPYLGEGFFPGQKKAGLDLKQIRGHRGLAVSLAPSKFDTKSTLRDRIGVALNETRMAFFRESMLVTEEDEQEILRVQDANDPYAVQVLENIFDDAKTLVDGAKVVQERMRMQLLAPLGGNVKISINANGTNYDYDYDANHTWKAKHYKKLTGNNVWSNASNCDPLKDIEDALDAQEAAGGNVPEILLMSKATFDMLKASDKVRSAILAQNTTANVNYTSKRVKAYLEEEFGVKIVVYTKKYKESNGGAAKAFYADKIVMMLPSGALGKTWFGTTPEERTLSAKKDADVSIVDTGVAVAVTVTDDPVNTKTTVSEIVLPSFENLDLCYALEVA